MDLALKENKDLATVMEARKNKKSSLARSFAARVLGRVFRWMGRDNQKEITSESIDFWRQGNLNTLNVYSKAYGEEMLPREQMILFREELDTYIEKYLRYHQGATWDFDSAQRAIYDEILPTLQEFYNKNDVLRDPAIIFIQRLHWNQILADDLVHFFLLKARQYS